MFPRLAPKLFQEIVNDIDKYCAEGKAVAKKLAQKNMRERDTVPEIFHKDQRYR